MMQLVISTDFDAVREIEHFFRFHDLPVTAQCLWHSEHQRHQLPQDLEHALLTVHVRIFHEMCSHEQALTEFPEFLARHNRLWVYGDADSALSFLHNRDRILALDQVVGLGAVCLFLDAAPSDLCWLSGLRNIVTEVFPSLFLLPRPRLAHAWSLDKTQVKHDYLLMMIKKRGRVHREVLWQSLSRRDTLLNRGLVRYRSYQEVLQDWTGWGGVQQKNQAMNSRSISADPYLDTWLEIVPETCYKDLYFFTEKTWKPMAAQTPFLMVSSAGYLQYLKQLGFRSFDDLVDESYDQQHRVQDRVARMLDTLEHIVNNGAQAFYEASRPVLQHNFARLCELSGAWHHRFDDVMFRALERTGWQP